MAVYKRGERWWYEFSLHGQRIRESAHTTSKTAATQIERERRRKLELSSVGVRVQKPLLFSVAAKTWLGESAHWSTSTREIYALKVRHLGPAFGKLLLNEITPSDISAFQRKRQGAGASNREINMECAALRMILRKHRLWHLIAPDYRPMRESEDTGKALTSDETHRLLSAAKKSRSLSLYPALILLMNTGLRVSELRTLQWRQIDLLDRFLTVGRSKTKSGEGRVVPLNKDSFLALVDWRKSFDNPLPSHFVFPSERYGLNGEDGYQRGAVVVWDRNLGKPIGSWKVAWGACRKTAGVDCRLHDLRHTFVSRLAEAQTADQTIMALAGHMSRKMMERYSHARNEAKRRAVEGLFGVEIRGDSPHFPPHKERAEEASNV